MAAPQFQLPNFANMPMANITDEADPARDEVNVFRNDVSNWSATALGQLVVLNPTHGFNTPVPNSLAAAADQATRVVRLAVLRVYVQTLFPIYAMGYARLAAALAGAPVAAVAPARRGPETKLPNEFTGKSAAAARHFMAQCNNYAALNSFPNDEHHIRWTLQLLDGDASVWRDEQFALLDENPVPVHLQDWNDFQGAFEARWASSHNREFLTPALAIADILWNGNYHFYSHP
jgi:hypothetical protein